MNSSANMTFDMKWEAREVDAKVDSLVLGLVRLTHSLEAAGAHPQVIEASRLAALDAQGLARRIGFIRSRTELMGDGA